MPLKQRNQTKHTPAHTESNFTHKYVHIHTHIQLRERKEFDNPENIYVYMDTSTDRCTETHSTFL